MFAKTGRHDIVCGVVSPTIVLTYYILKIMKYSKKICEMADEIWENKKSAVVIEKDSYGYVTAYVLQRMEHCVRIEVSGMNGYLKELYSKNEIITHYLGSDVPSDRIAKMTVGIVIV